MRRQIGITTVLSRLGAKEVGMVGATADPGNASVTLSPRLLRRLASSTSGLCVAVERTEMAVIVHVGGEVDACNETQWRRLLSEAVAATPPGAAVVIDLAGLQFISCGALEEVIRRARRCRQQHVELRLVTGQEVIRRVIADHVSPGAPPVFPSVEAALDHAVRNEHRLRLPHFSQVAAVAEKPQEACGATNASDSLAVCRGRVSRTSRSPWLSTVFGQLRQRRNRAPHVGYRTDHADETALIPTRSQATPAESQPTEPQSVAG